MFINFDILPIFCLFPNTNEAFTDTGLFLKLNSVNLLVYNYLKNDL